MKMTLWIIALSLCLGVASGWAQEQASRDASSQTQADVQPDRPPRSIGHVLLLYVPNRIFDVFDVLRIRARIGPGLAAGLRVTEPLAFHAGAYKAFWLGVHGPRTKPKVSWPAGVEGRTGLELLTVGTVDETRHGPCYQWDEIGADVQALVAGAAVGVSVAEAFDLITGLLFIDISSDDL